MVLDVGLPGHGLDDLTGGEVGHHRPLAMGEDQPGHQGEGVVLSDGPTPLIHQRQTVRIRIHGQAEIGIDLGHASAKRYEVLGNRLRLAGEATVGLEIESHDLTAQAGEQLGHEDAAGAAGAVQHDFELACGDAIPIDEVDGQDTLEMSLRGPGYLLHRAQSIRNVGGRLSRSQIRHELPPPLGCQEGAVGAGELQGVPLGGIMAGGDHDATGQAAFLDLEQGRGRGDESQVADVAAHRLQPGGGGAHEGGAAGPGVAGDGQSLTPTPRPDEAAEGRGELGYDRRIDVDADATSYPRDADDETVRKVHGRTSSVRARGL